MTTTEYTQSGNGDFWRTFRHDGKSALADEGGGARPLPFTLFTTMYKVAVYTPAERGRYAPPISYLPPIFTP